MTARHIMEHCNYKTYQGNRKVVKFSVFLFFWSMYLNLMKSDARDYGNPGCSFVDSSSEGDAAHALKQQGLVHELHKRVLCSKENESNFVFQCSKDLKSEAQTLLLLSNKRINTHNQNFWP